MAKYPSLALRIANVVGYLFLIAINVAASKGWLGPTNEKLSKKNQTPITPAGWAFSIWGFIFMLQGAGVVYQAIDHGYDNDNKRMIVEAVGYFWILGWLLECGWQFFFQRQNRLGMWLCMFCLLGALSSFAVALHNLYRAKAESSLLLYGLYTLPTSINTAWLSVASCIGVLIVTQQEGVPGARVGAVLLAGVATLSALGLLIYQRDTAYGLVLVWALAAVYAKQERWPVGVAAILCIAVNIVGIVFSVLRRKAALVEGDYVHSYAEL